MCSFYHEPLRNWNKTNVNKFAISNCTASELAKKALISHLKMACKYELHILTNTKFGVTKGHGENYIKVRPPLVRHLLRNSLLKSESCYEIWIQNRLLAGVIHMDFSSVCWESLMCADYRLTSPAFCHTEQIMLELIRTHALDAPSYEKIVEQIENLIQIEISLRSFQMKLPSLLCKPPHLYLLIRI